MPGDISRRWRSQILGVGVASMASDLKKHAGAIKTTNKVAPNK
jgi:hypothetical protein